MTDRKEKSWLKILAIASASTGVFSLVHWIAIPKPFSSYSLLLFLFLVIWQRSIEENNLLLFFKKYWIKEWLIGGFVAFLVIVNSRFASLVEVILKWTLVFVFFNAGISASEKVFRRFLPDKFNP